MVHKFWIDWVALNQWNLNLLERRQYNSVTLPYQDYKVVLRGWNRVMSIRSSTYTTIGRIFRVKILTCIILPNKSHWVHFTEIFCIFCENYKVFYEHWDLNYMSDETWKQIQMNYVNGRAKRFSLKIWYNASFCYVQLSETNFRIYFF